MRLVGGDRARRYDGERSVFDLSSHAQRYVNYTLAEGHPGLRKFAGFAQNLRPTLDSGLCVEG